MHTDFEVAVTQFSERQGVVEILGIGGVNSKGESVSEVFPPLEVIFR